MATSPTVLASNPDPASTVSASAGAPAHAAGAFPIKPLLLAVFAGVAVAALLGAGGGYWLVRSGKLSIQGAASAKQALTAPVPTHVVMLDPLVVNLADSDGNAYLRVT